MSQSALLLDAHLKRLKRELIVYRNYYLVAFRCRLRRIVERLFIKSMKHERFMIASDGIRCSSRHRAKWEKKWKTFFSNRIVETSLRSSQERLKNGTWIHKSERRNSRIIPNNLRRFFPLWKLRKMPDYSPFNTCTRTLATSAFWGSIQTK